MLIGYARVSTDEQELALQIDALQRAGCENIFVDKVSGVQTNRKGLQDALSCLQSGDVMVVWKLDRLSRSVKHFIHLVEKLDDLNVQFLSLTDSIDTTTPTGRFFFHIMASLAQMERELLRERTMAGLVAARQRGRVGGRPQKMTEAKIESARKLLLDGLACAFAPLC